MAERDPKTVVLEAYAAFGRGDIPGLLALLSEDVAWVTPGSAPIPHGGSRRGHAEVVEFFSILAAAEEIHKFEPIEIVVQDDKVVVLIDAEGTVKSTGRHSSSVLAHFFVVRDGKIVSFREFHDTQHLAKVFA